MYYKNTSYSVKTFHGVTFNPGQTQEVSDYINDKFMILVDEPAKVTIIPQKKPSSDNKKESRKEEQVSEVAKAVIADELADETKSSEEKDADLETKKHKN